MRAGFEWFVAWRYLRERGRRSGVYVVAAGVILLVAAAVLLYLAVRAGQRPRSFYPEQAQHRLQLPAIACLTVGTLVSLFGAFRSFTSIFTTISTFGVMLGTAALVIVLSVMNGFEVDLKHKILGTNAHVLVTKEAEGPFTEWREIEAKLAGLPGVVAHSPYLSSEVVVAANSNYDGVVIKGIDPATVGQVTDLVKNLEAGSDLQKLWPQGGAAAPAPEEPPDPEPQVFDGEHAEANGDADTGGAQVEEPIDFSTPIDAPEPGEDKAPPAAPRRDPHLGSLDGMLVGRELAKNLHLYLDEEVQVIWPLGQDTPTGQVPRTRRFRVAGKFFSGMYEYDTKFVYVTLTALQRFLSLGDEVDGIEIKIDDLDDTRPVVASIAARLGPGYRVQDWKELNRSLFSALKLEKIAMFLVLTIIILVASFSIISNLIMIVVEKAKEIAILKSMGAADRGIMRVFMIEGLYVGILGTAVGLLLGVGACMALGRFGLPLDPNVYYIDRLPVAMDSIAIGAVAAAGVALSFVATIYPAYIAARLRPVEGLKYL